MTNRMSDEDRLEFEQATGTRAEDLLREAASQSQEALAKAIREIQEVVGPHGAVTRLQAGGVRIATGTGIGVYQDGVLKTNIQPDGNFLTGSDITDPAHMTLAVFVNDQIYNNEEMGAGDILIGDNTTAISNVKYDASAGQLQFRYGTTIEAYMDTDGSIRAGGGKVVIDVSGVVIDAATGAAASLNAYKFSYNTGSLADIGGLYCYANPDDYVLILKIDPTGLGDADATGYLKIRADGGANNGGIIQLQSYIGGVQNASIAISSGGIITLNDTNGDIDTRISGDTDINTLYVDASVDRVGIGTATPAYKVDVNGDVNVAIGKTYKVNGSTVISGTVTGVTNGDSHDHNGGDGAAIVEAAITLADNTTDNASTSKHGFLKKLSNTVTQFMDGTGAWSVPDHANITTIGTNSHAAIDTHIALRRWVTTPKTANETRSSSATLANDSDLIAALAANTTYEFLFVLIFDTVAAADFKYDFQGPSTPTTFFCEREDCIAGGTPAARAWDTTYPSSTSLAGAGTTNGYVRIHGTIATGASSGNLRPRWAQDTSNGGNTTVKAGSFMQIIQTS